MKKSAYADAAACAGAVIGAGFASGKEVTVFFARYGSHAIWLSMLSAVLMAALMLLCMNVARQKADDANKGSLLGQTPVCGIVTFLLLEITAGAMISAAGHLVSLLWGNRLAYPSGALGTLTAAWLMGRRDMKILSWASAILTLMLLTALMNGLVQPLEPSMVLAKPTGIPTLLKATFWAAGYAGMNMTLASGVACRCGSQKGNGQTAVVFGLLMMVLLMLSSIVYMARPEWFDAEFPLVAMLMQKGRSGYLFSILILYLSVLTTLVSVVYSMRSEAEATNCSGLLRLLLVFVMPVLLSRFGFSGIVERFYAPAGLLCLAIIFLPLWLRQRETHKAFFLDNSR